MSDKGMARGLEPKINGGISAVASASAAEVLAVEAGVADKTTIDHSSIDLALDSQHAGLDVIYSDDDIVVLDKPSGLRTVPGKVVGSEANSRAHVRACFVYDGTG